MSLRMGTAASKLQPLDAVHERYSHGRRSCFAQQSKNSKVIGKLAKPSDFQPGIAKEHAGGQHLGLAVLDGTLVRGLLGRTGWSHSPGAPSRLLVNV